jgi:hypothetical protein
MRKLALAAGAAAAAMLASRVWGANPSIVVGNDVLIPNKANQTIQLQVTGGTPVAGVDLNMEIANGGTVNGGTAGPRITNVDLITGTIFAGNNAGQSNAPGLPPQTYSGYVVTSSGTVGASGLLATITIDTTGFTGQSFSLKLGNFSNGGVPGNTDFATPDPNGTPIPANITNGNVIATNPGDADLNGTVGFNDFATVVANYNKPGGWSAGDFNGNGTVEFSDFAITVANYNKTVPITSSLEGAAVAAPEPGALALLVSGLALAGLIHRRRPATD